MGDHFWRPISVDCLDPETFPDVALYFKTGGRYILYKNADCQLTEVDQQRMENSRIEFVYVRLGDLQKVNNYLSQNLCHILARDDLDDAERSMFLYQTSINHVVDIFEDPETSACLDRCRTLIRHMMEFIAKDKLTFKSLTKIISHNDYIFGHAVQVTALNLLLHEKIFGLLPEEMVEVGIGSLLHDFGMTFLSSDLLEKPGQLSPAEHLVVQRHTDDGYQQLKKLGLGEVALNIVRHHHERYNGQGYPAGLAENEIPRSAQLAAICDCYSALINKRSHRPAFSQAKALTMLSESTAAGLFNEEYFKRFKKMISTTKGVSDEERDCLNNFAADQDS